MESKVILEDVNAVFKPSTTTLILGPPGCGKSTLLKAIAGLLKEDKGHIVKGSVTYNGDTKDSGKFSLPKKVSLDPVFDVYCPWACSVRQTDRHLPTMTVQETFKFAFDCM
ncbi:unnamed protein product, partial [Scytosiphon promiscuus]